MVWCERPSADRSMTTAVKGLELMMNSTTARIVIRKSSVNIFRNNKAFKIGLIVQIIRSHAPPI